MIEQIKEIMRQDVSVPLAANHGIATIQISLDSNNSVSRIVVRQSITLVLLFRYARDLNWNSSALP